MNEIAITDYSPENRGYFRSLNYTWINELFGFTEEDERILSDPESEIISQGGVVLFASQNDRVIGTCALIKHSESDFELAKMAVAESARGIGAGRALGEAIIERARSLGVKRLFLLTHHKLVAAQALYKKLGFVDVDLAENRVCGRERCTIAMEINLA